MGRKAQDPELNALAKDLLEITFIPDADLDNVAQSFVVEDLRRIKLSSNFKTYHVRYFIGGKYRIIGYTKSLTAACRFADMAEWRFWKYRARDPHPPADSDLHFGVQQAKDDCLNETQAAVLLDKIEMYLRDSGVTKDLEAQRANNQKKKETRRTVRGDMYGLFADVMTALQGISDQLKRLQPSAVNPAWETAACDFPPLKGGTDLFKRDRIVVDIDTMKDFTVNVPHPDKAGEVLEKILIQIPVRRSFGGEDIIQPEGLAIIEQTKRDYLAIFEQRKQLIDIFSEPTTNQTPTNI